MSEGKRYDIVCGQQDGRTEESRALCGMAVFEDPDGKYVLASDYDRDMGTLQKRADIADADALNAMQEVLNRDAIISTLAAENARLREALASIRGMTDADDPDSYRCDDREGCFDAVFSTAESALSSGKEVK